MREREEELFEVLENLLMLRNQCSCTIFSECGLSDITVKQIAYLKTIDEQGDVTFSRLAEITRNSKPTITEMVNKFVRMECVYREPFSAMTAGSSTSGLPKKAGRLRRPNILPCAG
jgi:DNA-binding MarR family transcriptional regulator